MKIKLDENLPDDLVEFLEQHQIDSSSVKRQSLQGTDDTNLFNICALEERVLITNDIDFAQPVYFAQTEHYGIILLRLGKVSKTEIFDAFKLLIKYLQNDDPKNSLWIFDGKKLRIRRQKS